MLISVAKESDLGAVSAKCEPVFKRVLYPPFFYFQIKFSTVIT